LLHAYYIIDYVTQYTRAYVFTEATNDVAADGISA